MNNLTVFTPTYNRAYTLHKCYESLLNQTNKNFIWLIVDDGSTDNTKELVDTWIESNRINIEYFKKENGGKSSAHNKGVELADTELFVCVDSDDYLINNAVEKIINCWQKNKNRKVSGIVALKGRDTGIPLRKFFPYSIETSTLYNLYNMYGFEGDTMLIFRTEVLKKHLFPLIENEKFIPEAYVYDQIDMEYELIILNEVLYICEYLPDGYTNNFKQVIIENPKGYALFYKQRMKLSHNFYTRYRSSALYVTGNLLAGNFNFISSSPNRILTFFAIPAGLLIFIFKYKTGKFRKVFLKR